MTSYNAIRQTLRCLQGFLPFSSWNVISFSHSSHSLKRRSILTSTTSQISLLQHQLQSIHPYRFPSTVVCFVCVWDESRKGNIVLIRNHRAVKAKKAKSIRIHIYCNCVTLFQSFWKTINNNKAQHMLTNRLADSLPALKWTTWCEMWIRNKGITHTLPTWFGPLRKLGTICCRYWFSRQYNIMCIISHIIRKWANGGKNCISGCKYEHLVKILLFLFTMTRELFDSSRSTLRTHIPFSKITYAPSENNQDWPSEWLWEEKFINEVKYSRLCVS